MSQLTADLIILAQSYPDEILRPIRQTCLPARLFPMKQARGKKATFVMEYGDGYTNAATIADGGALNSGAVNASQVEPWLGFGLYKQTRDISGRTQRVARISGNPGDAADQLAHNLGGAVKNVLRKIAHDFYRGNGTDTVSSQPCIVGLNSQLDDTGSHMNVARSSSNGLEAYVIDPGTATPLTLDQIRLDLDEVRIASEEDPDVMLVGPRVATKMVGLFDGKVEYLNNLREPGLMRWDAGGWRDTVFMFDGCRVIVDNSCPVDNIYYLNSNYVEFQHLMVDPSMGSDDDGLCPVPLEFVELAKVADSSQFAVLTDIQLVVKKPNACGKRLHVSVG